MDYLILATNLKNLAITQYTNYNFNSFAKIGDTHVGFSEDGIYELDNASDDDGTDIDAFAELVRSDWGIPNGKRVRKMYVGYEADGKLQFTLTSDEGVVEVYTLQPTITDLKQDGGVINGRRRQRGRYWEEKISNTLGCDFSLDAIDVIPVVLANNLRGS